MIDMLEGLEFVEIDENDYSSIVVEGKEMEGKPRLLKELLPLVYDKGRWTEEMDYNTPLYFMFRDVCKSVHADKIASNHLRFDITIMLPTKLGLELNKTAGHYHPFVPSTSITYPELYEIIEGQAYFILQNADGADVKDVFIVKAGKGDRVIVPPNYGHVMVNVGAKALITANWVCRDFSSIYQPYADRNGAVYYVIRRFGDIEVIENESYENIPSPKFMKSKANRLLNLENSQSMYKLVENVDKLIWLVKPQDHLEMFDKSVIFEVLNDRV